MKKSNTAFSLIEVMIFTTILSIVLITTAAYVSRLIFSLRTNEHKIYANFYAEDLQEWLSAEREVGWADFVNLAQTQNNSGSTFCVNDTLEFNEDSSSALTVGACGSAYNGITNTSQPKIFNRELELIVSPPGNPQRIDATITVSWKEPNKVYEETLESVYTAW